MKRLILGVFGFLVFTGLTLGFTKLSRALPDENPATPITPTTEAGRATGGVKGEMADGTSVKLNFNAHQGSVWGEAMYSDGTGKNFKGDVNVCYLQNGNQAVFAGTVGKGMVTEAYFKVQVQDNGEGKKAAPDMFDVWLSDTLPTCTLESSLSATVMKGNLQVHQ